MKPLRCLLQTCLYVIGAGMLNASPTIADSSPKDLAGIWQGTLNAGGIKLRLVVHIAKASDGSYTGTMDSIDQQAKGIPVSAITFKDRKVFIEVKVISGHYEGGMSIDRDAITGTWTQGSGMPLDLKRDSKEPVLNRPQNPKPPFPYAVEEVTYKNSIQNVELAGTLTLPKGKGPFPAVVLITGSGPQDRDEALMGHKPFLVLADYLTRRGIAVLRSDDRGVGKSKGNFGTGTTFDFSTDVEAAVGYLLTRREINHKQIGLIGHSEGGVIAPMVAARSKDVAFIVLMAGTGVNGADIIYKQGMLIAMAGGMPEADANKSSEVQKKIFDIVMHEPDQKTVEPKVRSFLAATYETLPETVKKAAGAEKKWEDAQVQAVVSPWFRYFLSLDPALALQKVKCPVLAINGSKDLQVYPPQNIPMIEAALKQGGNTDYTTKILPDLNHLFQTCKTGSPSEYGVIEETIAPLALRTMGDWIEAHIGTLKK